MAGDAGGQGTDYGSGDSEGQSGLPLKRYVVQIQFLFDTPLTLEKTEIAHDERVGKVMGYFVGMLQTVTGLERGQLHLLGVDFALEAVPVELNDA